MDTTQTSIQTEAGSELASVRTPQDSIIVIKRVGWRRLSDASKTHSKSAIGDVRDMGVNASAIIKSIRELGQDDNPDQAKKNLLAAAAQNPVRGYDWGTLLMAGIVSIDGKPKTPETVDDLLEDVASACAREVLRLSKPSLFETEADAKNG